MRTAPRSGRGGYGAGPKALVLGRIGLIRSLGRAGVPVAVAQEARVTLERGSRYCGEYLQLPHLELEQERALEVLEAFGRRQTQRPVLFFNAESDVLLASGHRDRLGRFFRMVLAPDPLIRDLVHKDRFARLAELHGIPVPATAVPESAGEAVDEADRIGYPCVLKPVRQRLWHRAEIVAAVGWRKGLLVHGRRELEAVLSRLPPLDGQVLLQEYVPGTDDRHVDFHGYVDREGTLRGWLVGRKIRTFPVHFGQGCYVRSIEAPEVANLCRRVLERIGYVGAVNINLKEDARTDEVRVLEINPRFSLWTVLDACCGVNLPLLQYLDAQGLPLPEPRGARASGRWLWWSRDLKALMEYRRTAEWSVRSWLGSLVRGRGPLEYHVWARDDPFPMLLSAGLVLYGLSRRAGGRLLTALRPGSRARRSA